MMHGRSSSSASTTSEAHREVITNLRAALKDYFGAFPEVQRVILFGSWSDASWRPSSDFDLLVVLADAFPVQWFERWRYFPLNLDRAADCIVLTEQEIAQMLAEKNRFVASILEKGVVVYEPGNSDT